MEITLTDAQRNGWEYVAAQQSPPQTVEEFVSELVGRLGDVFVQQQRQAAREELAKAYMAAPVEKQESARELLEVEAVPVVPDPISPDELGEGGGATELPQP